jgi:hypothetical protein
VAGPQVLVAGQVLQGEAPGRPQHRLLEPAHQGVQGVAAQHAVDRQPGRSRRGGRGQHLAGVLQRGRQRLLAEHVAARAEGGQDERGMVARWGGDGHQRHPRVGQQTLGVAGLQAVGGGQGVGPGPVAVGHGHRAQPRQLPGRRQDQGPEAAGPNQPEAEVEVAGRPVRAPEMPEAEVVGGRTRRPGGPSRPGRLGQLRGSAWRSFTGSSRPVGVT